MKTVIKFKAAVLAISICSGLLVSSYATAKAPVWKVSKGDDYLYIGGTIHVLSKKDYPLPDAFNTAYKDSKRVIFETDIGAMARPEEQAKFMNALLDSQGRLLKDQLSKASYARLLKFMSDRNFPIDDFARFTPGGLSMILTVLELQRIGIAAAGVDEHFHTKASSDKKIIGQLETLDEQLGFIKRFSELDGDKVINSSLSELESINQEWQQLLNSWRSGDLDSLKSLGVEKMQAEFPKLYQFLLVDRNDRWVKEIKPMLETEEIEFLLVGALHLAGEASVLKQLQQSGYSIEQLD